MRRSRSTRTARLSFPALLIAAVLFVMVGTLPAEAAPGDLDPTFGSGGKVTTPIGTSSDQPFAVAVQSDGKIVAAGESFNGSDFDFALARYTTAGDLDTTFNGTGKVITPIGSSSDRAYAVALQSDGKIVAAGESFNGSNFDFALARYTTAGDLDTTFNGTGKVITPIGSSDDLARALALQSDGKIVVVGSSYNSSSDNDFALARYTTAGALDTTFGSGGKVITPIGSSYDYAQALALQSDGKIVVVGSSYNSSSDYDFALARYTSAGALDTTFGTGGKITTPIGSSIDTAQALALQSDGKIVAVGWSYNGSNFDFALARYTTAGALDTTFGSGGKVITPIGSSSDYASSAAIQNNGKIVVAGNGYSSNNDFALARYTTAGALDTTFGSGGKVITPIGSGNDLGNAVALQSDGKIVVVGSSYNGSNFDFALARYLGDPAVSIIDFAFSPSAISFSAGQAVTWKNTGSVTHTTTSDSTVVWPWDSGDLAPGATFTQAFPVAGSYTYHCAIHTFMTATVKVTPTTSPHTGTTSTTFTIAWAKGAIPSGYVADVQIKRPGSTSFSQWKIGQSGSQISAPFTPDAGAGTYAFEGPAPQGHHGQPGERLDPDSDPGELGGTSPRGSFLTAKAKAFAYIDPPYLTHGSGGDVRLFEPWDIRSGELRAIGYEFWPAGGT